MGRLGREIVRELDVKAVLKELRAAYADEWLAHYNYLHTAQIATGDWDAVLITHSAFGQIPLSEQEVTRYHNEQMAEIRQAILETPKSDSRTHKQLEKALANAEEAMKKKIADVTKRKDNCLTWDELGVDSLLVDEFHMFKNLGYTSKLPRMAGLPNTHSVRAMDMFMKSQHLLAVLLRERFVQSQHH